MVLAVARLRDPLDHPADHLALCYGGNGTTFSLVVAELLRDALLGRARPEARLFGLGR